MEKLETHLLLTLLYHTHTPVTQQTCHHSEINEGRVEDREAGVDSEVEGEVVVEVEED